MNIYLLLNFFFTKIIFTTRSQLNGISIMCIENNEVVGGGGGGRR